MKKVNSKDVKMRSSKLTKLFESYPKFDHLLNTEQRVWINDVENYKGTDFLVGHTKQYVKV